MTAPITSANLAASRSQRRSIDNSSFSFTPQDVAQQTTQPTYWGIHPMEKRYLIFSCAGEQRLWFLPASYRERRCPVHRRSGLPPHRACPRPPCSLPCSIRLPSRRHPVSSTRLHALEFVAHPKRV